MAQPLRTDVTLDPRIAAALAMLPPRPEQGQFTVQQRRELAAESFREAGILRVPDAVLDVRDLAVPAGGHDVPVRLYRPGPGTLPVLVWIHGGGWWQGSVAGDDAMCRRRAADYGCAVLSVEYRLAPENPFPAGLDDSWSALRWTAEQAAALELDPARIVLAGGSAGANLALACALLARDAGGPRLAALVLDVPAVDLTMAASADTMARYGEGLLLTSEAVRECAEYYLGGADPTDWRISPLLAPSLAGLPPTLVSMAEADPIRGDGEALARSLDKAGVPVVSRVYEGQVHGSMLMDGVLPDIADDYHHSVKRFLAGALEG